MLLIHFNCCYNCNIFFLLSVRRVVSVHIYRKSVGFLPGWGCFLVLGFRRPLATFTFRFCVDFFTDGLGRETTLPGDFSCFFALLAFVATGASLDTEASCFFLSSLVFCTNCAVSTSAPYAEMTRLS